MVNQHPILHLKQRLTKSTQELFDSPSRPFNRQRRFFLLMGAGALIASACSGNAQPNKPSAATSSTATKQVQHALGTTEVVANPSRIAVLDYFTVEALMVLGVQPIAAPAIIVDNLLHLPPAENEIVDVGNPREPSLEKLATLKPDLILATKLAIQEDTYGLLSQIAPTVVFDNDGFTEWQELTQLCGELLGKEAEAARLKTEYDAKLQTFRSQLSQDTSQIQVSVASFYNEQISVFGKETFIGTVLEAAGVSRPPKQVEGANVQISLELLNEIDGDVLFVMKPQSQTDIAADVRAALERMKANPLWNKLNVVQTNQVYEVDTYWFGMGYIAANLVLDDLMKYIVKTS
ncbi:MAG: iron-siderophore ABC transporter substrate-binding protein [Cyanobacteria bacterium P01_D01_bin.56]